MENQIEASEQSLFKRLLVYVKAQIMRMHTADIPTFFTLTIWCQNVMS